MKEISPKIKSEADKLLSALGFEGEAIISAADGVIFVNIAADSPALLIGRGGEGLEAFQHILRLVIDFEEVGEAMIVVDIEGYRNKKAENIKKLARDKAFLVISTGVEEVLPPMSAFERRIVHMVCTDIADVETDSTGEGRERKVVIKPKKK